MMMINDLFSFFFQKITLLKIQTQAYYSHIKLKFQRKTLYDNILQRN